jgi:hypothetical protein
VPFSRGGEDENNLELACGWCNNAKSGHMSVYDVEGQPLRAGQNRLGLFSLPQPFWVTRLLALEGTCSHGGGCETSNQDAELTVVPMRMDGALNITNLRVTCLAHDPLGSRRLQTPTAVRTLWGGERGLACGLRLPRSG